MNSATLLLAFTAGMVGAINPCGFSLLPAYIGSFVAGDDANGPLDRRLLRAVWSATSVTIGFVLVFVLLGVVLSSVADQVRGQLPWVTMVIGAVLVLAGLAVFTGRRVPMPTFALRAARGRGVVAMVTYGAVYALASLSCTIGPFLAVTTFALDQSLAGGLLAYVAYGLGMGIIILAIAASAALVRPRPVQRLRWLSRYASRVGGLLMVLSGSYAIWYARWELAVYRGDLGTDMVIETWERWRLKVVSLIENVGAVRLGAIVLTAVVVTIGISQTLSDRRALQAGDDGR
ncbi:MAG: cytochrome c biogenesis protein CcdA [Aquihabitans sp.]